MSVDFVRPMGVPPARDPRMVPPFSETPIKPHDSAKLEHRPIATDPVRGNQIDVKA